MALYSFITQDCNADLQKHGLVETVRKYAAKIEQDQSTGSIDLYPYPFFKRNVRKQFRLILEERRVGEEVVYCFVRLFQRGDSDYAQFMNLSHHGQLHRFADRYSPNQDVLQSYLRERQIQNRVDPLPDLSSAEHAYLMGLTSGNRNPEQTIIESRTWVERISTNIQGLRQEYLALINRLIWEEEIDPEETVIGQGKYWILYRYFPERDKLFLVAPLEPKLREKDEAELRQKYHTIFKTPDAVADPIIRQEGLRSYPSMVTADKELWYDIQDSKEANLSLSPEEMDVLNSVLMPSNPSDVQIGQKPRYPLFINGRPGSGKSTILLYLFAEHLHFYLEQLWASLQGSDTMVLDRPPIYLTYSDRLLHTARRIVQDILRCDIEKSQSRYNLADPDIKESIASSFAHFRSFLHAALPPAERSRFSTEYFVDYPHFRRFYLEKTAHDANPALRDLSPEIAWHVIRTYIKGMRQESDTYLDIEAYEQEVPRKQQTVSSSTFAMIYTDVWEKFYKPYCKEGYWDDQDLTRELLDLADEGHIELAQFPAVFCDESQDFTKIELELVFHLSRFSKRSIKLNELPSVLPRIPFAFAGDPFQTLNPTGFNWDGTKAFFHNSITRPLDPAGKANLAFNYQELEFNYRSAQPIVQFCNLIQLMRGRAFQINDLKPQRAWQVTPSLDPVYYDIAQPGCQQAMLTQEALIYIVPCQEGEEEAYVKQDPFLRQIAWDEEEQVITRDVLSPIRAKGLQFQRVVLYKFGDYALDAFQHNIHLFLDPSIDFTNSTESPAREETLPLEYFINHLYVAASRPQKQLIIVDTQKALTHFWAFAIESNQQAILYSYPGNNDWNADHICRLIEGARESWYQIKDDALKLGQDFFERGKERRDPYFLERARHNFLASGALEEANLALALKYTVEERFQEAGDVYVTLDLPAKALSCYWKSRSYEPLVALRPTFPSNNPIHLLLFSVAEYMTSSRQVDATARCIENIFNLMVVDKDMERTIVSDAHWIQIIQEMVQQLALRIDEGAALQTTTKEWKKIWSQLSGILDRGIELTDTISLARVACTAEEYAFSKDILEQNAISPTNKFEWTTRVFAETAAFPENIHWFAQLEMPDRLIEAYESETGEANAEALLSDHEANLIYTAYIDEQDYRAARDFLIQHPEEKRSLRLLAALPGKDLFHLANQVCLDLIHYYAETAQWTAAIQFTSTLPDLPEPFSSESTRLKMDPIKAHAYLIQLLARSEALRRESSPSKHFAVSEYLKELLQEQGESLIQNLHIHEAGAALERAGIFKDIFSFYESIINYAQEPDPELIRWAQVRWIKTKFRQASTMTDDQKRNATITSATSNIKSWRLPKNEIQTAPRHPDLDPLPRITLPVEDVPQYTEEQLIDAQEPAAESETNTDVIQAEHAATVQAGQLPTWKDLPGYVKQDKPTSTAGPASMDEQELEGQTSAPRTPPPSRSNGFNHPTGTGPEDSILATQEEPLFQPHASAPPERKETPFSRSALKDVYIGVFISLQVDDHIFDCQLMHTVRVLEIRDRNTQTRIDILGAVQEVRDSYGMLELEEQETERNTVSCWLIKEWSLKVCLEKQDTLTHIHLLDSASGKSLIQLQI